MSSMEATVADGDGLDAAASSSREVNHNAARAAPIAKAEAAMT